MNSPEIPFFETTIRYLGGFLSAYTLTSDKIFLTRADELAQILLPAFQTQSGLPSFSVDFAGYAYTAEDCDFLRRLKLTEIPIQSIPSATERNPSQGPEHAEALSRK